MQYWVCCQLTHLDIVSCSRFVYCQSHDFLLSTGFSISCCTICQEAHVGLLSFYDTHTLTHKNSNSLPALETHSPEHSCKKLQIILLLLLQSSPSFSVWTVSCSTSAEITLYLSCLTFFLSRYCYLVTSVVLIYSTFNVVLGLQSADEIVIFHINSPPPLSYIHTRTHKQSYLSMAAFTEPPPPSSSLFFSASSPLRLRPLATSLMPFCFFSSPTTTLILHIPLHTSCGVMCDLTSWYLTLVYFMVCPCAAIVMFFIMLNIKGVHGEIRCWTAVMTWSVFCRHWSELYN